MIWIELLACVGVIAALVFAFLAVIFVGFRMGLHTAGRPPLVIHKTVNRTGENPKMPGDDPYVRAAKAPRRTEERIKTIEEDR